MIRFQQNAAAGTFPTPAQPFLQRKCTGRRLDLDVRPAWQRSQFSGQFLKNRRVDRFRTADEQIVRALYTAAGIGQVVAARAYIAGASGGCQAEIGTASAMAAGALTALGGGTPSQITHAAAMALKNLLGLVCDPVGGLVEVPCVKRNVIGSVNALSAADMALAGIISRIPPDQVIDAMREVGDQMHPSLRETGQGGLANTPAAREWCAAQEEE